MKLKVAQCAESVPYEGKLKSYNRTPSIFLCCVHARRHFLCRKKVQSLESRRKLFHSERGASRQFHRGNKAGGLLNQEGVVVAFPPLDIHGNIS